MHVRAGAGCQGTARAGVSGGLLAAGHASLARPPHLCEQPVLRQVLSDLRRQHDVPAQRLRGSDGAVWQQQLLLGVAPGPRQVAAGRPCVRQRRPDRTCTRTRRRSTSRCTECCCAPSCRRCTRLPAAAGSCARCAAQEAKIRRLKCRWPPGKHANATGSGELGANRCSRAGAAGGLGARREAAQEWLGCWARDCGGS